MEEPVPVVDSKLCCSLINAMDCYFNRVRTWLLSRSTSASTVTLKKKLRAKKQSRSIWSKKYNAGSDCRSKQCTGAVCTSCSNDVKDGDETGGVDCGGVLCAQWADGKRCSVATDCASD